MLGPGSPEIHLH